VLLLSFLFFCSIRAQQQSNVRIKTVGAENSWLIADTLLNHPGLQIPKAGFYLSSSTIYRMALYATLHKQYAKALHLFKVSLGDAKPIYDSLIKFPIEDKNIQIPDFVHAVNDADSAPATAMISQSKPIKINRLLRSFQDGKKAGSYGLYIHVKQPIPGKRKRFKWFGSVGHSFITLIKYNTDGTSIQRTFGYYPKKHFVLEATPIFPMAASNFKNDSLHNWDESVGLFISKEKFHKILHLSRKYARQHYHLSRRNCTDFVLAVASISGIQIQQTEGSWPLGQGNDPGDTGQSLLERKIKLTKNALSENLLIVDTPTISSHRGAFTGQP